MTTIVAHRGYSAIAPENTLAAIDAAVRAGAHACEFDVRATSDGRVVLIHDEKLDRTTDGRGMVADRTLADIQRLDAGRWKAPQFAGERVPTLDQALARLKPTACRPVIEIKVHGIAGRVVEAVRHAALVERSAAIAFSRDAVRDVRRLGPRLRCGWLCDKAPRGTAAEQGVWIAAQAAGCGVDLVDLGHEMLSGELVGELTRRGLEVWTWTVDDPGRAAELARWGVTAVTTNDPPKLLGLK